MDKQKGITLIALIITILLMLILAGIVISLTLGENGILDITKYAVEKNNEASAREKLEILLLNMQAEKETNSKYNKDKYLTNKIEEQDMTIIDEDIVLVNGWIFKIDRNIPQISESLGKYRDDSVISELTLNNEEIIIGITNQKDINIENVVQIKVTTEGIEKSQYKWNMKNKDIATIDSNGNITPVAGGKTQIECKSIDGKKIYATCKLTVEEREYLYYHGTALVEFENPICGKQCTLSGSPYFREDCIYTRASNKNYPNAHQQINYVTKEKIDFSQYKGVGIQKEIVISGVEVGTYLRTTQNKKCNDWGMIANDSDIEGVFGWEPIARGEKEAYYDLSEYNKEAYFDAVMTVGEYQSGIKSTVDIYIYEIFLVK